MLAYAWVRMPKVGVSPMPQLKLGYRPKLGYKRGRGLRLRLQLRLAYDRARTPAWACAPFTCFSPVAPISQVRAYASIQQR